VLVKGRIIEAAEREDRLLEIALKILAEVQSFELPNIEKTVQECDATMKNSSNTVWPTKMTYY